MFKKQKSVLLVVVFALLSGLAAACGSAAPETVTVVETVEVEKEVAVVETVEVVKEVEVIVDPTECNLEAPAEAVEINMMGWSFPITDYYAEELEKCNKIENLTVNTNLLAGPDARVAACLTECEPRCWFQRR